MTKHIIMVSGVMLLFFFALSLGFCAEEITITTYYPSPYGSYNKLTTNSMGIGDVDNDGSLDDGDAPDPSTQAGDLWLDGKINIGMNSPFNICVGGNACSAITSGGWNIFIGSNAGLANTTGQQNVFIGPAAGGNTTTGNYNTFIGMNAGQSNTSASNNTFLGRYAGYYNTTGGSNTFLGVSAGQSSTTGTNNAFLGTDAGLSNTTGFDNTFLGRGAGRSNTTGFDNAFLGMTAGYSNTTGGFNTFLGAGAGDSNTTGSNNVFVGYKAGSQETGSNTLYIDNSNTVLPLIYGNFSSNAVTINGDFTVTGIKAFTIQHPLKPDYKLVHSTLEGPENAVFYRGEAQLQEGAATVKLPDYFEALTLQEARTVVLTCKDGFSPLYIEGKIKDGQFTVKTTKEGNFNQAFYWEVKAARKDVPPLAVEIKSE